MSDEMNSGEISRVLARLERGQAAHGAKLDEIREQTMKTNGYVGRHEERLTMLDRDVRDLKLAAPPPPPPSLPIMTPEGESLSIKISPKMWALIASAFMGMSMFGPILAEWLKRLVTP